jgi:hypothetical protein
MGMANSRVWLTAASTHFGERPDSVSAGVFRGCQDASPCGSGGLLCTVWTAMCLDIL